MCSRGLKDLNGAYFLFEFPLRMLAENTLRRGPWLANGASLLLDLWHLVGGRYRDGYWLDAVWIKQLAFMLERGTFRDGGKCCLCRFNRQEQGYDGGKLFQMGKDKI